MNLTNLNFHFQPLASQDQNGPGVYYKVYWRRLNHDTDFQYETLQESGNIGMTVVHIKTEFFYTQYEVKVQVRISYLIDSRSFFIISCTFTGI